MKNFSKNFLWALIILMLLSAVYSMLAGQFDVQKEITLSDLVAKINAGEVGEIKIIDSSLEIKLKNGEELNAEKEIEAGLAETLRNYGVDPEKLKTVNLKVENKSAMNFLLGIVL